jgi:hypothetical protein
MAETRSPAVKLAILVAATVVLATLVVRQAEFINGSRFHRWGWWTPPAPIWRLLPVTLAAAIPFAIGLWIFERRNNAALALGLLTLSTLLLQSAVIHAQPGGLDRAARIVAHDWTTSYFTDARPLLNVPVREWLAAYDKLLPGFHLHSREKPPGPILYWWMFLRLFHDARTAALAGAFLQGMLASLAVPATFWLARVVTRDTRAAFFAACWLALIPTIVLFFPGFDQCYPLLACGIVGSWIRAIETRRGIWAIACGAILWAAIFFSYSMLTLGALMALLGVHAVCRQRALRAVAIQSAIVLSIVVLTYAAIQVFTGFNPLATFAQAWQNQEEWEAQFSIPRTHPATVPSDLLDFFLGSAWISALLIAFWLFDLRRQRDERSILILLCLVQPLIVAATGLLQCETARVWSFMQPLVLIAVGVELSRWKLTGRVIAYLCLFILLNLQARSFIFQF